MMEMKNKAKLSILFLIVESVIITFTGFFFLNYHNYKISVSSFAVINFALIAAVHGMNGFFFGFPFYRQHPEDNEENRKNNKTLRFVIMITMIVFAVVILNLLFGGPKQTLETLINKEVLIEQGRN